MVGAIPKIAQIRLRGGVERKTREATLAVSLETTVPDTVTSPPLWPVSALMVLRSDGLFPGGDVIPPGTLG